MDTHHTRTTAYFDGEIAKLHDQLDRTPRWRIFQAARLMNEIELLSEARNLSVKKDRLDKLRAAASAEERAIADKLLDKEGD